MEQIVIVVIALVLLGIPFFYLAKAIFFFRENRNLKYRSVYIRSLIYFLVALIFIGIYFTIPAMVMKMETARRTAPIGAYSRVGGPDTIMLDGLQFKHRFGNDPVNNYSSTYIISSTNNDKDFWNEIKNSVGHYLLGQDINIYNEILTLNYPVRDATYNLQPNNNKKSRKKQPTTNPQNTYIINRYFVSLRGDTLFLAPVNGPPETYRFLRFANFYK